MAMYSEFPFDFWCFSIVLLVYKMLIGSSNLSYFSEGLKPPTSFVLKVPKPLEDFPGTESNRATTWRQASNVQIHFNHLVGHVKIQNDMHIYIYAAYIHIYIYIYLNLYRYIDIQYMEMLCIQFYLYIIYNIEKITDI